MTNVNSSCRYAIRIRGVLLMDKMPAKEVAVAHAATEMASTDKLRNDVDSRLS